MTIRYRHKPVEIEAFQFHYEEEGIGHTPRSRWPEWLLAANYKSPFAEGAFYFDHSSQRWRVVWLDGGRYYDVLPGDYIVKFDDGRLNALNAETFEQNYEAVE